MSVKTDEVLQSVQSSMDAYIKEYIKKSEESGYTETRQRTKEWFNIQANTFLENYEDYNKLTTAQTREIQRNLYNYTENVGMQLYDKSLQDHPREANNVNPVDNTLNKDLIKTVLSNISKELKSASNKLLKECESTSECPNEEQASKYFDSIINQCIAKETDLKEADISYIKTQAKPTKEIYLKKYREYAKDHKITDKMPWGESETSSSSQNLFTGYKSEWVKTNTTYSGCDAVVSASMVSATGKTVTTVIGEAQTFSYSMYEKIAPIHAIGNMNAKDYVHGLRTFAGSLILVIFDSHWAANLMKKLADVDGYGTNHYLVDEMPPLDITLSFANEYGTNSRMALYGVRFYKEGIVFSINDIYTEGTYEFVAMDIDYIANVNDVETSPETDNTKVATTTTVPTVPAKDGGKKETEDNAGQADTQSKDEDSLTMVKTIAEKAIASTSTPAAAKREADNYYASEIEKIEANNEAGTYKSTQEYIDATTKAQNDYQKICNLIQQHYSESGEAS